MGHRRRLSLHVDLRTYISITILLSIISSSKTSTYLKNSRASNDIVVGEVGVALRKDDVHLAADAGRQRRDLVVLVACDADLDGELWGPVKVDFYIGLGLCKGWEEETNRHESGEEDGVDACRAGDGVVESFGGGECAGESYG